MCNWSNRHSPINLASRYFFLLMFWGYEQAHLMFEMVEVDWGDSMKMFFPWVDSLPYLSHDQPGISFHLWCSAPQEQLVLFHSLAMCIHKLSHEILQFHICWHLHLLITGAFTIFEPRVLWLLYYLLWCWRGGLVLQIMSMASRFPRIYLTVVLNRITILCLSELIRAYSADRSWHKAAIWIKQLTVRDETNTIM